MKPIHLQITITIDGDTTIRFVELLTRAIEQGTVQCRPTKEHLKPKEEMPEAKPKKSPLEASRHAHFGGEEPPEDRGLLIDGKEVARLLDVSPRTVWRLKDGGRMPKPIRIGNAVRWSYDEIKKWIEQGCPSLRRPH